jgi:uncharacterized LabA/DUF88 family protein
MLSLAVLAPSYHIWWLCQEGKKMERVVAYVDGFNLYFGLRSKGWKRYYWLNIQTLIQNILKPDQRLAYIKYFTSRVKEPLAKVKRQNTFLEALGTLPGLAIFYGKYQLNPRICRQCGFEDLVPNEKMSDVNIATELLVDAFRDRFDTALLISADGDLKGPVVATLREFPDKRVVVVFPPARHSVELASVASASFTLGRAKIEHSLFPPEIRKPDGFILKCPEEWK